MERKWYGIYARQSIDKSDSISIETQIERCLVEVGDEPYQIYADRGYSGKNTDRPQFRLMIDAVRRGEIACVVCYKLDRCSRSILDFTQLMELFQQHNVAFISCTEKFDTASPMGRAMLNICIVFAQLERETIQQRITDAYHSRCKKGYFMGGRVPFGFSLVPCLLDGKKTSCYEAVPEEADILGRIYSIYKEPDASLSDVVLVLDALQIKNPRRPDGLWVRPHISRMIRNPIYVMADKQIFDYYTALNVIPDNPKSDFLGYNGCYLYHIGNEQHLVLAPHRGIIPSDVWLPCQKRRSSSNHARRQDEPASWLTGKLVCGICNRAVALHQTTGKNGRHYRYFLCSSSRGKVSQCSGFKPFQAEAVEVAITHAITQHIRASAQRTQGGIENVNLTEILREMLSALEWNPDATIETLKQLLLNRNQQQVQGNINPKQWDGLINRLANWADISPETKRQIVNLMIETVQLSESCITIRWLF